MRKDFFGFLDWKDNFYDLFNMWPFEPYRKTNEKKTEEESEVAGDLTCHKKAEIVTKNNDTDPKANFLQVLGDLTKWPIPQIYTQKFEYDKNECLWVYKTNIGKDVKPEDIDLYVSGEKGRRYLDIYYKSSSPDGCSMSCVTAGIDIPGDENSVKAKLKSGVLTITCEPIPAHEEPVEEKEEFDPEQEYEIDIEKI